MSNPKFDDPDWEWLVKLTGMDGRTAPEKKPPGGKIWGCSPLSTDLGDGKNYWFTDTKTRKRNDAMRAVARKK